MDHGGLAHGRETEVRSPPSYLVLDGVDLDGQVRVAHTVPDPTHRHPRLQPIMRWSQPANPMSSHQCNAVHKSHMTPSVTHYPPLSCLLPIRSSTGEGREGGTWPLILLLIDKVRGVRPAIWPDFISTHGARPMVLWAHGWMDGHEARWG